jgi:uncharacterized membrane protein YcaP (DUF421 family)
MSSWLNISWNGIFILHQSPVETFIRGSLVYLSLFLLLRFGLRREWGIVGMSDLLVVVLIAESATEAMAAKARSLSDCIVLAGTIVFWAYALDWLGYRFPLVARLLRPPAVVLVRNGQLIRRNMRSELITHDELMSHLREHGVQDVAEVRLASMEGDGRISVVTDGRDQSADHEQQHRAV